MRIAQVAPLFESVPPKYYGGTDRVVSYLTEELVRQGHEVTLFASGDSVTEAHLVAPCPRSLRRDAGWIDRLAPHVLMVEQVFRDAPRFDVIHFHIDCLHFPSARRRETPQVTTLHGRLDAPEASSLYKEFSDMPVVSISNAQREPLPWLNWQGTVYNGLPEDLYTFRNTRGSYLAFLGRICPEKCPDRAIEIAKRIGMPIKIAARLNNVDREYFEQFIEPHLSDSLVEYVGEISDLEEDDFLGNAYVLLFPLDWPEPFGMAMIEAMACGTPVVASRRGSVQEVIEDGATGFIFDGLEEAVKAVERIPTLNRKRCREAFEQRFSARRMAQDYQSIYTRVAESRPEPVSVT